MCTNFHFLGRDLGWISRMVVIYGVALHCMDHFGIIHYLDRSEEDMVLITIDRIQTV